MTTIELIMENGKGKTLSLFFRPHDTDIARRYLGLLENVTGPGKISEPDRTYNFPGDIRHQRWIWKELEASVATINAWRVFIEDVNFLEGPSQRALNVLHHHFEKLRGSVKTPSMIFLVAPPEVKEAIYRLNILIHRFEDRARVEAFAHPEDFARMVVTFTSSARLDLLEEDYEKFSLRPVWGRWYIDYYELGKPLYDVYMDRDEIVGDANIRPLRSFGANALVSFSKTESVNSAEERLSKFHAWWDENEARLSALGFRKGDPKNALGNIGVADLIRDRGMIRGLSRKKILRLIGKYPRISGVKLRRS